MSFIWVKRDIFWLLKTSSEMSHLLIHLSSLLRKSISLRTRPVRSDVDESCNTCGWAMSHIWMSHVTHMVESYHSYEWVMSHTWMSHVTHIWMSHVTHMDVSCHTYGWVVSLMWMSHVTHTHMWMSHITHINELWTSREERWGAGIEYHFQEI